MATWELGKAGHYSCCVSGTPRLGHNNVIIIFYIFGGLSLDEWLEEDEKENVKPNERHAVLSKKDLE